MHILIKCKQILLHVNVIKFNSIKCKQNYYKQSILSSGVSIDAISQINLIRDHIYIQNTFDYILKDYYNSIDIFIVITY